MRTVFVSGASGVLGSRLVHRLRGAGFPVRALVQPNDPRLERLAGTGCELWRGDIQDPKCLAGAFAGVGTVFHLAAVILSPDPSAFERINTNGTANMVSAAADGGARHFVYVSSASVIYPNLTLYAAAKLAGETLVKKERRFAHTIVRPTLVYDENGGQELLLFWEYLQRFPIVPLVGGGRARKRPVFAGDIVEGLFRIAGNPKTHGKTYNFSGSEAVTLRELGALMLETAGRPKPFVAVPIALCRLVARVLTFINPNHPFSPQAVAGLSNDADLPPDAAVADLGFQPLGVRAGLPQHFPRAALLNPIPRSMEAPS